MGVLMCMERQVGLKNRPRERDKSVSYYNVRHKCLVRHPENHPRGKPTQGVAQRKSAQGWRLVI